MVELTGYSSLFAFTLVSGRFLFQMQITIDYYIRYILFKCVIIEDGTIFERSLLFATYI